MSRIRYGGVSSDTQIGSDGTLPYGSSDSDGNISIEYFPVISPDLYPDVEQLFISVLKKFGIPYFNPPSSANGRGMVKGFDVRSMDASQVIRLSLSEYLIDKEFWEVYIDENGVAFFVNVGSDSFSTNATPIISTPNIQEDIRAELVVIRGFDKPPIRKVAYDRTINVLKPEGAPLDPIIVQAINPSDPQTIQNGSSNLWSGFGTFPTDWAYGRIFNTKASIVYMEPSWDSGYEDQIKTAYRPKCFESLLAWKMSLNYNLVTQHDVSARVDFSSTSTVPLRLKAGSGLFTASLDLDNTDLSGYFTRENYYNENISTFEGIANLYLIGYRVKLINETLQGSFFEVVEDDISVFELSEGGEYTWEPLPNSEDNVRITFIPSSKIMALFPGTPPMSSSLGYLPIGDALGYLVYGLWANVTLGVPSVNVTSKEGKALDICESMISGDFIKATPVVMIDLPSPVYYKFNPDVDRPCNSLDDEGFINHEEDLVDADPTTQQPLDDTPSRCLQDSSSGLRIVDVSLPFVKGGKVADANNDCLANDDISTGNESDIINVRDYIYDLYNNENEAKVDSTKDYLFTGQVLKDSQLPKLGQRYEDAIINSISYSFQDSSSFDVNISTGRMITSLGSWGTEIYERRSETITRTGTVLQTSGNAANYVVKVDGLGIYTAISSVREDLEVGDRVNVSVYNSISEK